MPAKEYGRFDVSGHSLMIFLSVNLNESQPHVKSPVVVISPVLVEWRERREGGTFAFGHLYLII